MQDGSTRRECPGIDPLKGQVKVRQSLEAAHLKVTFADLKRSE